MRNGIFSVLMFWGLTVSTIHAADFNVSIGFGGDIGLVFTSFDTNIPEPYKSMAEDELKNVDINRTGFLFYLDLTYFEIDLGGKFYNATIKQDGVDLKETQSYFNIGLMGKYPFSINKITLFPFIGFDLQIFTKVKDTQGGYSVEAERSDLSSAGIDENYFDRVVFNFGFGADFAISDHFYIRSILFYGINAHTKYQEDQIDIIRDAGYNISILNHGPSIKLALGYKF
jgi:hypothetical protein